MGGIDKGTIKLGEPRMIDVIYENLREQSDHIVISGTHDYGLGLEVISDDSSGPKGPAAGLFSILKALPQTMEGFFTVAVDTPNIPRDLLVQLYSETKSAIACDTAGRHPSIGWWRRVDLEAAFEELDLSSSISLNRLADLCLAREISWPGDDSFFNINKPEDMANYLAKD